MQTEAYLPVGRHRLPSASSTANAVSLGLDLLLPCHAGRFSIMRKVHKEQVEAKESSSKPVNNSHSYFLNVYFSYGSIGIDWLAKGAKEFLEICNKAK